MESTAQWRSLHDRAEWIVLAAFHVWIAFLNSQLIDQTMQVPARNAQCPRALRFAPSALAQLGAAPALA